MIEKTILITGGCGFIGTSLIHQIRQAYPGNRIRVLDNFTTGTPEDLATVTPYVEKSPQDCDVAEETVLVKGDIRDFETASLCSRNVDAIVHLAANTGVGPSVEDPKLDMESNVFGTFNMLEAARQNQVANFVFASSGAPAGEVDPPIHEELPPHPVSPYGASKLAGEGYCSAYFRTFGINTVCLRFGNVFGPRSKKKASVVAKFIRQAMNGEPCVIYGDGGQTRDFVYVDDLVNAILLSLTLPVGGETFQIATGREHTVEEAARMIAAALKRRDVSMDIQYDSPRLGDVKRNYSDTAKARKMLGWEAGMTLEEGIENTIDYFFSLNRAGQRQA